MFHIICLPYETVHVTESEFRAILLHERSNRQQYGKHSNLIFGQKLLKIYRQIAKVRLHYGYVSVHANHSETRRLQKISCIWLVHGFQLQKKKNEQLTAQTPQKFISRKYGLVL